MRITHVSSLALVAALSLTLLPRSAAADQGEGALRVGADVYLLDLSVFPNVAGDPNVRGGVLPAQLAVGVGYQLNDSIVIGARTTFGYAGVNVGGPGVYRYGVISLLPFFEYMFIEGDIRPFVGAHAGPTFYFPDMADTQVTGMFGGEFGVHLFADDAFSFSPALWASFLYDGSIRRGGFSMGILVSLEGWLFGEGSSRRSSGRPASSGGGRTREAADPTDPASYEQ